MRKVEFENLEIKGKYYDVCADVSVYSEQYSASGWSPSEFGDEQVGEIDITYLAEIIEDEPHEIKLTDLSKETVNYLLSEIEDKALNQDW